MTKKTRDDAIYVAGIPPDIEMEQIEETFSTVGPIKVRILRILISICHVKFIRMAGWGVR